MTESLIKIKSQQTENESDPRFIQLENLWKKIEKHEKRNANLTKKMAKLFQDFEQNVLPLEQRQCQQMSQQILHLTKFVSKKTLKLDQRDELFEWIDSDITFLESHPFAHDVDTMALRQTLTDTLSQFAKKNPLSDSEENLALMREMLDDMFDGQLELTDEQLAALARDPSLMQQHIDQLHQKIQDEDQLPQDEDFDDEDDEYDPFADFFNEHQQHLKQECELEQSGLEKLFKSSQINKMYKRLAFLLHPDKEQDQTKKAEKHQLMHQLTDARIRKDAFVILKLYQQYVPDAEFSFNDDTLEAMEKLLQNKVNALNHDHTQLKQSNDLPALVWRKFSARSKKATQQNFEQHISALEEDYHDSIAITKKFKTVKALSTHLSHRIREKEMSFFNFAGSIDGFFS